ncbi:hypothetical protein EXN24_21310 [Rhizobium rhizogenes]|uniref:Uncharacterized protein n=1 Tax=Rhizobium rhizogenes TaxID=359 RepID=A0AA94V9W0_RHIRH|nr:hypothetical protein EXN24_21310 [Rhizobium rhizogenes]
MGREARRSVFPVSHTMLLRSGPLGAAKLLPWLANVGLPGCIAVDIILSPDRLPSLSCMKAPRWCLTSDRWVP